MKSVSSSKSGGVGYYSRNNNVVDSWDHRSSNNDFELYDEEEVKLKSNKERRSVGDYGHKNIPNNISINSKNIENRNSPRFSKNNETNDVDESGSSILSYSPQNTPQQSTSKNLNHTKNGQNFGQSHYQQNYNNNSKYLQHPQQQQSELLEEGDNLGVRSEQYYTSENFQTVRSGMMSGGGRVPEKFRDEKDGSEIYVTHSAYNKNNGSMYSYSGKSRAPSELSSVKTKNSRGAGVVVETMAAPNPFCPNTKGVCCLLVLLNLGLILVTLGFSIVLQLFEPPFVWYCGIAFLIVGFIALISSLVFCTYLCEPGELYWTHHWQKKINIPGMGGGSGPSRDDDIASTIYSENERRTPIHSYRN